MLARDFEQHSSKSTADRSTTDIYDAIGREHEIFWCVEGQQTVIISLLWPKVISRRSSEKAFYFVLMSLSAACMVLVVEILEKRFKACVRVLKVSYVAIIRILRLVES